METYQSEHITELAKAMLKVRAELQPALKDRENPFTRSNYATLNSVMDACRDALVNNGVWLVQHPVPTENGSLGLVTKLVHAESGQWHSSLMVMPLPKADPQGYGSALTYARRYSLSALIGIVTEDDDDGEAASGNRASRQARTGMPRAGARKQQNDDSGARPQNQQATADTSNILSSMPRLDGISYEAVSTTDGKLCIVAKGDTRAKKQLLTQAGFRWSPERHIWWRYADAA
jgi:hypothetical protein